MTTIRLQKQSNGNRATRLSRSFLYVTLLQTQICSRIAKMNISYWSNWKRLTFLGCSFFLSQTGHCQQSRQTQRVQLFVPIHSISDSSSRIPTRARALSLHASLMIDERCQLMCADKPLDVYINININDISSISEMKMVSPRAYVERRAIDVTLRMYTYETTRSSGSERARFAARSRLFACVASIIVGGKLAF
jgi:hypothetical protein